MEIRTYQPGDDIAQVRIYNEAAGKLPKFKAATVDEVQRRARAADYDPAARFLALVDGQPVAYAGFQNHGRVSYPWCRQGHEAVRQPLFELVLQAMKERGLSRAFTAYRADWQEQLAFFQHNGFQQTRAMINFVLDRVNTWTPLPQPSGKLEPATPADIPTILELGANILLFDERAELEQYLFHNPYFPAHSVFVQRVRPGGSALAVGVLIANPNYADPRQVDAAMPCFRLGAFGTEGMSTKRINGLFSFLSAERDDVESVALDLLAQAAQRMRDAGVQTLAAQVPSDAGHLLRFYQHHFQQQASFPILERIL